MLAINHFMPNNCNINVIDSLLLDQNAFISMNMRTFKKFGDQPTCLFDQGFFANYRQFDPMIPQ